MTNKEYREHEGVSRSQLGVLLTETPMHFKFYQDNPKDSSSLNFGRACHKYILEKDEFYNEFAIIHEINRRTKEGKAQYEKFLQEHPDHDLITSEEFEQIKAMREVVWNEYPELVNGKVEQSFFWIDDATGEQCKCRPDVMVKINGRKYIVDYKTTDSCADGHFERSAKKYGYKMQAGMYREGVFQNNFDDYGFIFLAQEKKAPYAVRVYECTDEFLNEGYDQFREAIAIYHECKTSNNWYGYERTCLIEEGE